MDPAVSVQGLCVTYRRRFRSPPVPALVDLELQASPGEIVGVLGPNGSGKTTLFGVLSGTLRPTSGRVTVLGRGPTHRELVDRVGYQPEGPLPFPTLHARAFLHFLGDLMRLPTAVTRSRADRWLERLDLGSVAKRPIGTFSTGMARRLALAAAFLAEPEVLLLDEPTSGLDPRGSLAVLEAVREAAAGGATVMMASHRLEEVEQVCTRVYLLHEGQRRAEGSLDDLLGQDERTLVVRDLDEEGVETVRRAVQEAGGELVRVGREREHVFALFRRLEA